eukprot:scaffold474_cov169-Ochromonas_danica.AAC.22
MVRYENNPTAIYPDSLDLTLPKSILEDKIKHLVVNIQRINEQETTDDNHKDNSVCWSNACIEDLTLTELSGGITNRLYLLSYQERKVIVRCFGKGTEFFIDRSMENLVFAELSKDGFGPHFWGLFQDGRIEGYIPSQTLQPNQMKAKEIYPKVAQAISTLHQRDLSALRSPTWLWQKIYLFFDLASQVNFKGRSNEQQQEEAFARLSLSHLRETFDHLVHSIDTLRQHLHDLPTSSLYSRQRGQLHAFEEVLCHNDLLSGNILLHDDQVTLIDFEYAAYNFRAFDLANHFCEFGGFDFDIVNEFPSSSLREDFIRYYLLDHHHHLVGKEVEDENCFVEGFEDIVLVFALVSHFFWGSWSVVQAGHTTLDFDYLAYANKRFEGFHYHRKIFNDLYVALSV